MKLPLLDAVKLIKILEIKGYKKLRQKGSHVQFKNDEGILITVPTHAGRPIGRGLLRKILMDMEISREEFLDLVKQV
jgi:predicted RNA binding protein YcfA (HicA-like mRNA interferase family)